MDTFFQVIGGVLIAALLGVILSKQGKETGMLLTVLVSCMVLLAAFTYLAPVIEFFERLQQLANLDSNLLDLLLKSVGIGLIGEIASTICVDTGSGAMGKAVQILSVCVILCISIPALNALIDLIQKILGEL